MNKNITNNPVFYFIILLLIIAFPVFGQNVTISGKVANVEKMTPLENALVSIPQKSIQVWTNEKGVYEIKNLSSGSYTLTVNYLGFNPFVTTITVNSQNINLDVVLYPKPIRMNEVVISGYRESYTSGDNYSATRTNANMMTLPLSTGQITNKLLSDQNCINMNDALRNVSGVATEFGGPHPLIVNIRGFSASIFKDGFRVGGYNNISAGGDDLPVNSIALDRVEVLKGPSTILYGRGEPGGIVNFISKQPQAIPGYSIETMGGSFQQYRIGGSATGPLLNNYVSYRLDGSYENSNSYREFVKNTTYFVKPSFAINFSEKSKLYLMGEYSNGEFTPDHGVMMLPTMSPTGVLSGDFAPISSRTYNFGESTDKTIQKQQRGIAEFEQIISPAWTIKAAANLAHVDQDSKFEMDWFYTYDGAQPMGQPPGTFPPNWSIRLYDNVISKRDDLGFRLENLFKFNHSLFGAEVSHNILLSADALKIETKIVTDYNPNQMLNPVTGERVNLTIPVFIHEENLSTSNDYGVSFQDLITIGSRWHVLLGGRYESNSVDVTQLAAFTTASTNASNSSSGLVPRIGVLYQVNPSLSLYASYMGSYQSPGADYGIYDIPSDLKPERAYQVEGGIKMELFDKKALVTASYYVINKYDVISSIRNPAGVSPYKLYFNIGKEDAQGFDLDIVGEFFTNLRLTASFNTQTMKFTNSQKVIVDGKQRYGTPTFSGNFWALYQFNDGMLNGLGIGGGVSTRSSVFVNDANEASVPAFTTLDAVAYYEYSKLRFQLNLLNITNELAYSVANMGGFGNPTIPFLVMPIPPFRLNFTVRYQIR